MTTELVLECLEHAIWTRQRDGVSDLTGVVHHTDAGSQYTAYASADLTTFCRLDELGLGVTTWPAAQQPGWCRGATQYTGSDRR